MFITAKVTGPMIRDLQNASTHAALVEVNGHLKVVHHLPSADLADDAIVLRHPAAQWADALVALARETAEAEGTSTHLTTLRAAAGRLATDELAEERTREDVVTTPRRSPSLTGLPTQLASGRRSAAPTPEQLEAETHALCALLDQLEDAGLVIRAA
ncbi:MAG: hypothetical protein PGN11_05830 [Quadrisphaera sp.]